MQNEVKRYLKDSLNKIDFDKIGELNLDKIIVSQMVQLNMQIAKLNDLLLIATGVNAEEVLDIEAESSFTKNSIREKFNDSIMCPKCGKGVVVDSLGYCPNCKEDLSPIIKKDIN